MDPGCGRAPSPPLTPLTPVCAPPLPLVLGPQNCGSRDRTPQIASRASTASPAIPASAAARTRRPRRRRRRAGWVTAGGVCVAGPPRTSRDPAPEHSAPERCPPRPPPPCPSLLVPGRPSSPHRTCFPRPRARARAHGLPRRERPPQPTPLAPREEGFTTAPPAAEALVEVSSSLPKNLCVAFGPEAVGVLFFPDDLHFG